MKYPLSGHAIAAASFLWLVASALAFQAPTRPPLSNFDNRLQALQSLEPTTPAQRAAWSKLRGRLPSARVEFDAITGAPRNVMAEGDFLTGPGGSGKAVPSTNVSVAAAADLNRATRNFLFEYSGLFGHGPEALDRAAVKRDSVTPQNGMRTVVWQQELDGLPLFEAVLLSHITRDGALVSLSSQFVADPAGAADRGVSNRLSAISAPAIPATRAVAIAAQNVGEDTAEGQVAPAAEPRASSPRSQPRLFTAPGIKGVAEANLVWLPVSPDRLSLCWEVIFTSRSRDEMFRVLVDATTGVPWVRHCLTQNLSDASYNVFTNDSPTPFSPGHANPSVAQPDLVERALITLSALDTNASPAGWIDDDGNETRGNNVDAHTDRNADNLPDLPRPQGAPWRVFDYPMDLAADDPTNYAAASVVQLFYLCNWMHDKLYALGFDEAAGNFQSNNFGRGGQGSDAVAADAQDGAGFNNANFSTPPDGAPGRMQMYLFPGADPRRDGDLDAEVVLHEYTHGLSNRRVGGGIGISTLQSAGMGEGWSDFFALSLLSQSTDDPSGNYALGAYVSYFLGGSPAQNYYFGIRRYPYTTDMSHNPLTFKDIDSAQAENCSSGVPYNVAQFGSCSTANASEVHNQGEVWCVALWEIRANLIARLGWAAGNQLVLQLVADGMTLSPPNPNFLQARDAILAAELVDTGGSYRDLLWEAFAKRGLGFSATSPPSSTTTGLREAFDLPDDLRVVPIQGFVLSGPIGGPFATNPLSFILTNTGSNTLNWTVSTDVDWLMLGPTAGAVAPGGAAAVVSATVLDSAANLPPAIHMATVWFTNQDSGLAQSRPVLLRVGQPDSLTELFENSDNDLSFTSLTFVPDGTTNYYAVCREAAASFATDPNGGSPLSLTDDSYAQITLDEPYSVTLFGRRINTFFIGSNGYLTLDSGDINYLESPAAHFSRPRVSALFHDLNPGAGGTVSWRQLADRVAVTYQDVPQYGGASPNSFQIELFSDGRIRLTWLQLTCPNFLAGLSAGQGLPAGYAENDLSASPACPARPPTIVVPPANNTLPPGLNVTLNVVADGSAPLAYQWLKDGNELADDGRIAGATGATLSIKSGVESDSGKYVVRVSNGSGSIASSPATLLVTTLDHFAWAHIPSPQSAGVPLLVQLQARDSGNSVVSNFNGIVAFKTPSGAPAISPGFSTAFVQGVCAGTLTVAKAATNLVLQVDDGFDHLGFSEPIQIRSAPLLEMQKLGNALLLTWPAGAPGLKLESSPRIIRPRWQLVDSPVQIGDQFVVPIPMTEPQRFYRLRSSTP